VHLLVPNFLRFVEMLSCNYPKIHICPKKLAFLVSGSRAVPRGDIRPSDISNLKDLPFITSFQNNFHDRELKEDFSILVHVPSHLKVIGFPTIGKMNVENRGFYPAKVEVTEVIGTKPKVEVPLAPGEKTFAYFEGHLLVIISPDGARIAFNRHYLSNFVGLEAVPLFVDGSDAHINAVCLEILFQSIKASLTNNDSILEEALSKTSCPDLKKFMGKAAGVPSDWFSVPEGEQTLANRVMEYLQAWCLTCPKRFALIRELMDLVMEHGVRPENVQFFEYSDDSTYGVGAVPGDFRPILEQDYVPKGKNQLGPILSALACQAIKGTHADYINWFRVSFPNLFVLDNPAQEDEDSVLGTRTASEADLEVPSGRTPSNGRSLSQEF
jgi:hypothetical protein